MGVYEWTFLKFWSLPQKKQRPKSYVFTKTIYTTWSKPSKNNAKGVDSVLLVSEVLRRA